MVTTSGLHVSTLSSHHQALQKTSPRLSECIVHTGIPRAFKRVESQCARYTWKALDLFFGGPDDDSRESKHVAQR